MLNDLLTRAEEYVCAQHDGEPYFEPVLVTCAASIERNEQASKEAELLVATLPRAFSPEDAQLGLRT